MLTGPNGKRAARVFGTAGEDDIGRRIGGYPQIHLHQVVSDLPATFSQAVGGNVPSTRVRQTAPWNRFDLKSAKSGPERRDAAHRAMQPIRDGAEGIVVE